MTYSVADTLGASTLCNKTPYTRSVCCTRLGGDRAVGRFGAPTRRFDDRGGVGPIAHSSIRVPNEPDVSVVSVGIEIERVERKRVAPVLVASDRLPAGTEPSVSRDDRPGRWLSILVSPPTVRAGPSLDVPSFFETRDRSRERCCVIRCQQFPLSPPSPLADASTVVVVVRTERPMVGIPMMKTTVVTAVVIAPLLVIVDLCRS